MWQSYGVTMTRSTLEQILATIKRPEGPLDLAEAALLVAEDARPEVDADHYLDELSGFAEAVKARLAGRGAGDALFVLNEYLYDVEGFAGSTPDYDDPSNNFLDSVIDRRQGLPLTLSLVYLTVGRLVGLPLQPVAFPGYFLVKLEVVGEDLILDPYNGGVVLGEEDLETILLQVYGEARLPRGPVERMLRAATAREVIVRMLRNLKRTYMHAHRWQEALWAVEGIVQLHPGQPQELRDRGRIFERLQCYPAAIADYSRYLEMAPAASDVERVWNRLVRLHNQHPVQVH